MPKEIKWHLPEEVEEASSGENPVTKFLKVWMFQQVLHEIFLVSPCEEMRKEKR